MRKSIQALALALLLAVCAHAGEMQNGKPAPPPPSPASSVTQDGEMQNGAADSLTETVLNLIENVFALL